MSSERQHADVLRDEWLARQDAAHKRRTPARLAAASAAFQAYREHQVAAVPPPRQAVEDTEPAAP